MKTEIEIKLIANVKIDIGAAIEHPHHLGGNCVCGRSSNNNGIQTIEKTTCCCWWCSQFVFWLWCQPTREREGDWARARHSDALIRTQFLTSGECEIGRDRERAHTYSCNKSIIPFRNDCEDASMWLTLSDYIDNLVAFLTRAEFFSLFINIRFKCGDGHIHSHPHETEPIHSYAAYEAHNGDWNAPKRLWNTLTQ